MDIDMARRRMLGALGIGALGAIGGVASAQPEERVVKLVAKKFVFEPEKIELVVGQPVRLELTAPEVPMGFSCYELGLRTDIVPERVAILHFTPDKPGLFRFSCDVFCGSGHEEMDGAINVM